MSENNVTQIKAILLSEGSIQLNSDISERELYSSTGNIVKNQWIFLRISQMSRVRVSLNNISKLMLFKSNTDDFFIKDITTQKIIANHVTIERIMAHAPEQLFFLLYKNCINCCLFCPLTYENNNSHYDWERIRQKIINNLNYEIKSVSFTTSCPLGKSQDELVDEIINNISKTRKLLGEDIPIGVSLMSPTNKQLSLLKEFGATEIRLNLETYNTYIAKNIMPKKDLNRILHSIEMAVDIFGKEKVSSNIIVGLGESDDDVLKGVNHLAEIGALATLYPYDSIGKFDNKFKRPSAERLYNLAIEQKKIFCKYNLNPLNSKTMCCQCAASHIFPGRDL